MKLECQERIRHDCLRILDGRDNALEPLRNTELVIVGGTGFVGTLIAEMVAALNDAYQFDTKLTLISRSTDQFANRLPHLGSRTDINLIKSDVRQLGQFPANADWVIHAAANPDVRTHASNPLDTASVIVDGTMSVMRTAETVRSAKTLSSGGGQSGAAGAKGGSKMAVQPAPRPVAPKAAVASNGPSAAQVVTSRQPQAAAPAGVGDRGTPSPQNGFLGFGG